MTNNPVEDVRSVNVDGWKIEPGSLDKWNAKQEPKFEIASTGGDVAGTHFDGPRVALSKGGKVVAIECESLNTFCLVSPKVLRRK